MRDDFNKRRLSFSHTRPISAEDGDLMANRIRAHVFFECSSKTGEKVNDIFETAAIIVLMNNKMKKSINYSKKGHTNKTCVSFFFRINKKKIRT